MYLLKLALLWCSCITPLHSSLPSSWRPAHVSWLEFFGKFSLLEAFLVILYPDILGPNYRVQNRTPTLLGEVISDDQFLSWIWYSYKTLKLALQRRLGIELSTQASTKNNTVTKHQNPPSTQPLGLSNTHFLTLDETYALKTHRHLSSFIPASTLTSAVWQNSTKAGLLESKETAQVLRGTTLSCYALHKIKMHFQTHVLSGLLQVSLYFPSAAMFVKCFSRPLYLCFFAGLWAGWFCCVLSTCFWYIPSADFHLHVSVHSKSGLIIYFCIFLLIH